MTSQRKFYVEWERVSGFEGLVKEFSKHKKVTITN